VAQSRIALHATSDAPWSDDELSDIRPGAPNHPRASFKRRLRSVGTKRAACRVRARSHSPCRSVVPNKCSARPRRAGAAVAVCERAHPGGRHARPRRMPAQQRPPRPDDDRRGARGGAVPAQPPARRARPRPAGRAPAPASGRAGTRRGHGGAGLSMRAATRTTSSRLRASGCASYVANPAATRTRRRGARGRFTPSRLRCARAAAWRAPARSCQSHARA
jgi:hypothetical protein